jgi:hypothetical protein
METTLETRVKCHLAAMPGDRVTFSFRGRRVPTILMSPVIERARRLVCELHDAHDDGLIPVDDIRKERV